MKDTNTLKTTKVDAAIHGNRFAMEREDEERTYYGSRTNNGYGNRQYGNNRTGNRQYGNSRTGNRQYGNRQGYRQRSNSTDSRRSFSRGRTNYNGNRSQSSRYPSNRNQYRRRSYSADSVEPRHINKSSKSKSDKKQSSKVVKESKETICFGCNKPGHTIWKCSKVKDKKERQKLFKEHQKQVFLAQNEAFDSDNESENSTTTSSDPYNAFPMNRNALCVEIDQDEDPIGTLHNLVYDSDEAHEIVSWSSIVDSSSENSIETSDSIEDKSKNCDDDEKIVCYDSDSSTDSEISSTSSISHNPVYYNKYTHYREKYKAHKRMHKKIKLRCKRQMDRFLDEYRHEISFYSKENTEIYDQNAISPAYYKETKKVAKKLIEESYKKGTLAVSDTGCTKAMASEHWLKQYLNCLRENGVDVSFTKIEKYESSVVYRLADDSVKSADYFVNLPICIKGYRGTLEVQIVKNAGVTPLLIGLKQLKAMNAHFDFERDIITILGNSEPMTIVNDNILISMWDFSEKSHEKQMCMLADGTVLWSDNIHKKTVRFKQPIAEIRNYEVDRLETYFANVINAVYKCHRNRQQGRFRKH